RKPREKTKDEVFLNPWGLQDSTRAFSRIGVTSAVTRNLLLGFLNHPEALAQSCEMLASLPVPDRAAQELRNELLAAAFSGAALDRHGLATILSADGATGSKALGAMGFSFTRRDSDP